MSSVEMCVSLLRAGILVAELGEGKLFGASLAVKATDLAQRL